MRWKRAVVSLALDAYRFAFRRVDADEFSDVGAGHGVAVRSGAINGV